MHQQRPAEVGVPAKPTDLAEALDAYFASCPDVPVFGRNVDLVGNEEAFPTPEAAVRSVAARGVEVVEVDIDGRSGEIQVRSGKDSGTFFVQRRRAGWFLRGGEGCAAWPAAREVVGDSVGDATGYQFQYESP